MWQMKWTMRAEADEAEGGAPDPVSESADSKLWDGLFDDDESAEASGDEEGVELVEEVGGEAEPEPVKAPEPEPKPEEAVAPIVEEKPAAVVAPQPVAQTSQPAPQPTEAPAQQGPSPEVWESMRRQAFENLQRAYTFSEEDASALQVEPEKVLPKLAANLHVRLYEDLMNRMAQEAPAIIERVISQKDGVRQAEDAFFSKWETLRPHADKVRQVATMWRQMYPNATMEEAIDGVGQAAMSLLGLQAAPVPPAAPTPPPAPARPAARGPVRQAPQSKLSAEEQAFADLAKTFEEEF